MYGISISSIQFPAWTVNIQNWIYWRTIRDICSCYTWYSVEYFAYYVEFTESCVHSCKCLHSFQTSVYSVSARLFPGETVAANTNNLVAEYMILGCHFTPTYTDALTDQQLQCMPPSLEDMHTCWADKLNTYLHFCVLAKAGFIEKERSPGNERQPYMYIGVEDVHISLADTKWPDSMYRWYIENICLGGMLS